MLRNYRDYYRDTANRYNAYVNNNRAMNALNQANFRANQVARDQAKFGGRPTFSSEKQAQMFNETFPMMEEYYNRANAANYYASEAMNNEMTQVQDRKMDLADNEQGRKNLETEYMRAIEQAKIDAALQMNARDNQSLDNMNNSFAGLASELGNVGNVAEVPEYDLYDQDNRRIGGSYFRKSLLG